MTLCGHFETAPFRVAFIIFRQLSEDALDTLPQPAGTVGNLFANPAGTINEGVRRALPIAGIATSNLLQFFHVQHLLIHIITSFRHRVPIVISYVP